MFFSNWSKEPDEEKFVVELSFFTSWTIENEKCTRAHAQENKSIYLSIYISRYMKTFLKTGVYSSYYFKQLDILKNITTSSLSPG